MYCDWSNRDSLLVSKEEFLADLSRPFDRLMQISRESGNPTGMRNTAHYFLPPYEWYNDSIAAWSQESGRLLVNFTPGTRSNADYTWPGLPNYISSKSIYESIINYEKSKPSGLNGFLLLLHIGTDPKRTDKFYHQLPELIRFLKSKGYQFQAVDELLGQ